MRQWFKIVALGAVAALAVAVPGAAVGYEGDDAPNGATERVTEQVMEQTQSRLGQPDDVAPGTMEQVQERNRLQLRDGSGENCVADCDGDQVRDRDRLQLRDGSGENCVGDCDGDQVRDRDRDQARDGTGENCVADCDGDQVRDGSGEDCVAECDGDQLRDKDRLRQQLQDCEAGCRAAWQFTRQYGCHMHVAV